MALNYNSNGQLTIQLPQGPASDLNRIYIFVNVIDDTYGTTVFNIPTPITVLPDNQLASNLASSISSNDPTCAVLVALNSGNLNVVVKNVIGLTTVFNIQSIGNVAATATNANLSSQINQMNNDLANLRDYMVNIVSDLSVTDLSSIKVISSALSVATQTPQQVTTNAAVCVIN